LNLPPWPCPASPRPGSKPLETRESSDAGTVIKVAVSEGQRVTAGELVLVLEAMKMKQLVNVHKPGIITKLSAQAGGSLVSGASICEIADLPRRTEALPSTLPSPILSLRGI
jgi:biotin carboxyl carrier protein